MKPIFFSFILLLSLSCAPKGQLENSENPEVSQQTPDSTGSVVKEVPDAISGATSKPNEVSFNGMLVLPPERYASVTVSIGGSVLDTKLLPGTFVRKGSVLATLVNPEFITLQQNYLEALAQAEYLSAEYERQQSLSEDQAASQKRLQQSKAEYLSVKARMQAAAAQLSLLGISPSDLEKEGIRESFTVVAPISGYAGQVQMNVGKFMAPGEPLCVIIDKSEMLLKLTAYEKDLGKIVPGEDIEFRVNGLGDSVFHATLLSVDQQIDEVSRSLDVYATVKNRHELFRPGMYATARVLKVK